MATGRGNKLVGQTGEYLVAAELSRRGLIATTFTGNVPYYDIIASDETGRHVSVQVKASTGTSWMLGNIENYCDIAFDGKRQVIGKVRPCPIRRLVMVFVKIDSKGADRFYILPWIEFRHIAIAHHKAFLSLHGGIRPKKWDSLHCAVAEHELVPHRDKWEVVERSLG